MRVEAVIYVLGHIFILASIDGAFSDPISNWKLRKGLIPEQVQ